MKHAVSLSFSLLLLTAAAAAADFPPISEKERALGSVPGEPNAPAVILFKKAEFLMWGYDLTDYSSRLLVRERRKILTEEGKALAEVAVPHSDDVHLTAFRGRTVLPDGRVLPLKSDARFERKVSKRQKAKVTTVAFPGVEVGAILDYEYELRFLSIFVLEPWYFSDDVPVVLAEVLFKIPGPISVRGWNRDPFQAGIHRETKDGTRGKEVRVWAENLPSVPDEPFGLPFADLATQVMMVPTKYNYTGTGRSPLLDSWETLCKGYEEDYARARRRGAGVEKKGRELARMSGARERAEAVYRFVRDDIKTLDRPGIGLEEGSSVERTLDRKSGDSADKALLLQSLLSAVGLESRLVWAADRRAGEIDPQLPNPRWFDSLLVAMDLDGQRVYLDPTDRALAFGQLRFGYEGTPALICDKKKPEGIVLPETPFDRNGRRAVLDLAVDGEGRISGKGEIAYTGHRAWEKIDWQDDDAATLEAWKKWLGEEYEGFQIEDVRFEEKPDEQAVRVTWSLRQREEEVLGDESSFLPSRPLGPTRQPFVQDGSKRRSPVLFDFPDRDEVELRLTWPETWRLEQQPKLVSTKNRAGAFSVEAELDDAARTLVYRRRLDLTQRQLATMQQYEEARALFGAAEKSDAEELVLLRN